MFVKVKVRSDVHVTTTISAIGASMADSETHLHLICMLSARKEHAHMTHDTA